jgi:DNA polymerase-3 subunit delta
MNNAEPLYLLLGPELGQKTAFIGEIRDALKKTYREAPEEYKYYSFDTPVSEVITLLRNASLFSAVKLVVYQGAEEIRKKDDINLLLEYAKNPSKEGVLLLLSDKASVEKKLQDPFPPARKKVFWELFDNQKKGWVLACFHKYKTRISSDAADLFLEVVENNTQELERECRNLCFFFGEDHEISVGDIETYLYHGKQESVFSLFETMAALDLEASLEILHKILLEGDSQPVQLLAGLLWQFRNLQSFKILMLNNFSSADAFGRLKIFSKRNQRTYGEGHKNFTPEELEDIIVLFADFDEELRSVRSDTQSHLIDIFLYSIIRRKGKNFLRESA